jgi:hypothetical protein
MKGLRNILLVLGLSITATMALPAAQIQQPRLRTSYTIILKKTHVYPDGRTIDVYTEKRFVAPTGEWFSVKVFADGRLEKRFGKPGNGVYMYNPRRQKVDYIGPYPAAFPNPKINLKSHDYVTTDTVLGYNAYLLRSQTNGMSVDSYLAPDLNGDIIKQVITRNGVVMRLDPVIATIEWSNTGDPVPAPRWSPPAWWSLP